ncbi:MAG TPA: feruloyl-CoA synthase [Polyangiaceae bacterium]
MPRPAPRFAPAQVLREPLVRATGAVAVAAAAAPAPGAAAAPAAGFVLRSPVPLASYARSVGDVLARWAREAPERAFLAERADAGARGGWRTVTYAQALAAARSLGQALLDRGLDRTRPLLVLSGNGIDHALLSLAAMHVGVPVAPVSTAYSLVAKDPAKLRALAAILAPGAVYAEDGAAYGRALATLDLGVPCLVSRNADAVSAASSRSRSGSTPIAVDEALRTTPTRAVDDAFAAIGPDTVAKILFTSGSTGTPKGVVNTQRMLCSNQQAIAQTWPFLADRPPVVVDWLPWSHTFGGNHNFFMVLWHGGTLYVDAGKPAPGLFDETLRNLRAISPTLYFNVPRGFDLLASALETDAAFAEHFFAELDLLFYAAAALPQSTWVRLEEASARARGRGTKVTMVSAWGATETAPLVTQVHFPIDRAGVIGLPAPGCELAFVPVGNKLEMRVRGPCVTPGAWGPGGTIEPNATDERGFYPTGDAGMLEDDAAPERGVVFGGRIAENFKLASGTWVHVGELRVAVVAACAPLVADAVVAGHDRDDVGLLVFPAPGAGDVRDRLRDRLAAFNASRPGTSTRVARALVLTEPPSIDAGEITDKGYLNQRAVLDRRAALVERLYAGASDDPEVVRID